MSDPTPFAGRGADRVTILPPGPTITQTALDLGTLRAAARLVEQIGRLHSQWPTEDELAQAHAEGYLEAICDVQEALAALTGDVQP